MSNRYFAWSLIFCCFSHPSFGYGSLAEFVNSTSTAFRDVISGDSIQSSDIIASPKWPNSSLPLQLELCAGSSRNSLNYGIVRYQTTKQTEILADISTATNSWSFGSGSSLSFSSPTATSSCPESNSGSFTAFDASHKLIRFSGYPNGLSTANELPAGVLAYTPTTIQIQGGELSIVDGDIIFNKDYPFVTHACDTLLRSGSSSGTCPSSASNVTFLGVLTHELGHFIGISHSVINDDNSTDGINTMATMYPSISSILESRAMESPELDDQLAREFLYPSAGFPSSSTGSISGFVMRNASLGQRGAHVAVFDVDEMITVAGVYSSMSGSQGNPTGAFSIDGLPLNHRYAVFVEPVDRTADGLSTSNDNINTPIAAALDTGAEGYSSFQIEAYPDASFPDVRLDRSASANSISSAQVFELTSSNRSASGLKFYLNQTYEAPNDAKGLSLSLNSDTTLTADNPIQITISNPNGLDMLNSPSLSLTGAYKKGTSVESAEDWSSLIPSITYSGTELTVSLDSESLNRAGLYQITATLTDSKYGTFTAQSDMTFQDSGGGGCSLRYRRQSAWIWPSLLAFSILAYLLKRRTYRKSFTSRASILSRPKQS